MHGIEYFKIVENFYITHWLLNTTILAYGWRNFLTFYTEYAKEEDSFSCKLTNNLGHSEEPAFALNL